MCSRSSEMTPGKNQPQAKNGETRGDVTRSISESLILWILRSPINNLGFEHRIFGRMTGCPLQTWINK